jgi:hypothetical protein
VGAAVKGAVRLYTVAYDLDTAVLAGRGERVDRALEAVEHVRLVAGRLYSERLVEDVPDLQLSPSALGPFCGDLSVR